MPDRSRCTSCTCSFVIVTDFFLLSLRMCACRRIECLFLFIMIYHVYPIILPTGLTNDPYLVHREIIKLREKETKYYVRPCFVCFTYTAVCRIKAVSSSGISLHTIKVKKKYLIYRYNYNRTPFLIISNYTKCWFYKYKFLKSCIHVTVIFHIFY